MQEKPFDLIVWDWDGTIADSTGMITLALIKAAEQAGLPALSAEKASSIIGLGLRESIHALFGEIPAPQAQSLMMHYNQNYYAGENQILLFSGIYDTIAYLSKQGYKLAVATGKGRRGLNTALKNAGLDKFFVASKTVDECFSKPHPQMLDELMDELVVMPERTLMIGDSEYDMQMGKNAGVVTAAVTYGSQSKVHLAQFKPDYMFDDVTSLKSWLENL
jgi:phosphoglycolate phosphatase